jgi:hypothetical protein
LKRVGSNGSPAANGASILNVSKQPVRAAQPAPAYVDKWPIVEIAPACVKGKLALQAIAATVNSRA